MSVRAVSIPVKRLFQRVSAGGGTYVSYSEAEEALNRIFMLLGVHVGMRRLHNYSGAYDLKIFEGRESAVPTAQVAPGGRTCLEEVDFMISPDGKARPCCVVLDENFVIGDLRRQSFGDILSGAPFLKLRHKLRLDQLSDYKECAHCCGKGSDTAAVAAYWGERLSAGEITDPEEISYLSRIAMMGGVEK